MNLLTVKEIADILKVKHSTIYAWSEQRLIPCIKINGALRFSETEILSWLKNCKNSPNTTYNKNTGRRPKKGGQI
jgi:excisionase family DNA binding protein